MNNMKDIKVEATRGITKLSSISETSRSAKAETKAEIAATVVADEKGKIAAHNQRVPIIQQKKKKAKVPTQDLVPIGVLPYLIPK